MSISTYKKWMKESYLYEADDEADDEGLEGEMFDDPVSGDEMSVLGGLRSSNDKTKKAAQQAKEKLQGKEPDDKDKGDDVFAGDDADDYMAGDDDEEAGGEEPSGEEPSDEPKSRQAKVPGKSDIVDVWDQPDAGQAMDDEAARLDEPLPADATPEEKENREKEISSFEWHMAKRADQIVNGQPDPNRTGNNPTATVPFDPDPTSDADRKAVQKKFEKEGAEWKKVAKRKRQGGSVHPQTEKEMGEFWKKKKKFMGGMFSKGPYSPTPEEEKAAKEKAKAEKEKDKVKAKEKGPASKSSDAESKEAVQDIDDVEAAERAWRKHQAGGPYADYKLDRKGSDLRSAATSAANKVEKRRQAVIDGEVEPTPEEAQASVQDMEAMIKNWHERPYRGTTPGHAPSSSDRVAMEEKLKQYKKKVKHMKKGFLGSKYESIKVINGKKYRAIQESVNKRIHVKEVYRWLKTLEEFRYRKIPTVEVRRITSFVNNDLREEDLPITLQKKWEHAKYSREKHLADKFMKERINKKISRNESKHPLKEQYDRLFTNRTVL